jgi:hypothetical protein
VATNQELVREFDHATKRLHEASTGSSTGASGAGAEVRYAEAHRALVRAGLARPLRRRYRR